MEGSVDPSDQTPQAASEGQDVSVSGSDVSSAPLRFTREKPISILVGPEKIQYFVHKGLLSAKSPYFNAMLKDCWDGKKEEVELRDVSSEGFGTVADWMYSGKLPSKMIDYSAGDAILVDTIEAYKAADVLMISELQNTLTLNHAVYLSSRNANCSLRYLQDFHDHDLCHTKLYNFALRSAVLGMMRPSPTLPELSERQEADLQFVEDNTQLLTDVIRTTMDWGHKRWDLKDTGDVAEFYV